MLTLTQAPRNAQNIICFFLHFFEVSSYVDNNIENPPLLKCYILYVLLYITFQMIFYKIKNSYSFKI